MSANVRDALVRVWSEPRKHRAPAMIQHKGSGAYRQKMGQHGELSNPTPYSNTPVANVRWKDECNGMGMRLVRSMLPLCRKDHWGQGLGQLCPVVPFAARVLRSAGEGPAPHWGLPLKYCVVGTMTSDADCAG